MPADQSARGLRVDAKSFGNLSVGERFDGHVCPPGRREDSGRMVQRIGLTGGCATEGHREVVGNCQSSLVNSSSINLESPLMTTITPTR